jgi:hypothetical protein
MSTEAQTGVMELPEPRNTGSHQRLEEPSHSQEEPAQATR